MKKRLKIATDLALLLVLAFAPYFLSAYHLSLLGRFLAMAILSLGISITWGRAGILSLGQGVFWGLGAYVLAMHLKLAALAPGDMPDFMMWSGLDHLPAWWNIFRNPAVARLQPSSQRCLLRSAHPGPCAGLLHAPYQRAGLHRRLQRPHRLQHHPRSRHHRPRLPARALLDHTRCSRSGLRLLSLAAGHGLRQGTARRPRWRKSCPLSWLQPCRL
jgi:hypothetical protein